MIEIKHKQTGQVKKITRRDWEKPTSPYRHARDLWQIVEEGDPVVLGETQSNGTVKELWVTDRDHAIRIMTQPGSENKYRIIELENAETQLAVPIKGEWQEGPGTPKEDLETLFREDMVEWLRYALSTRPNDQELIQDGFTKLGLIGYAFSQKEDDTFLLQGYNALDKSFYSFWEGQELTTHQESTLESNDFQVYLIGEWSERFDKKDLLPAFNFISEETGKQLILTNPDFDHLKGLGYSWSSGEPGKRFCLSRKPFKGSVPVFVYSTREVLLFEPISVESQDALENTITKSTDADLLPDSPSKIDDLGRKKLMELVSNKLEKVWPQWHVEPFQIMLNGEWGSGKTTMLNFLEHELRQNSWEIVKYNAWMHQHFEDQWWMLVSKVSEQIANSPNRGDIRSHRWWSFKLQNHNTLVVVVLAAVFLGSTYGLADYFLLEGDNITLYAGLIGLLGSIWVTFTGMVQNIFRRRVTTAELAKTNTADPYKEIKDRFNEIAKGRKLAIFIDDLDRCEIKPTVSLLEGIQNLFKGAKVLYVIAADGNWISNCFNQQYAKFKELDSPGHSVGSQFLQKSFQMVVDVPKISAEQHKRLWEKYLGIPSAESPTESQRQKEDVNEKIASAQSTEDIREAVSEDTTMEQRTLAAEKLESIVEERKEHILYDYMDYVPRNPRQMKRLINQFIVKYQSLILTGTANELSEDALIRYIIFASSYPDHDAQIRSGQSTLEELLKKYSTLKGLLGDELNSEKITELL